MGVVGVLTPVGVGYRRLCTAPRDAYPVLDGARTAAQAEVGVAAARTAGESWGERLMERGAAWRTQALDRAIQIKQSDGFAFPLHVVTGLALEAGRCPAAVVGDQWRKAAFHASSDWAAS